MQGSDSILRDLRALPMDAPAALRERVRALGEPAPPRRSLPIVPWRRSLLVLAPACALALVIAAVVHGLANSGAERQQLVVHGEAGASDSKGHWAPATAAPPALRSPFVPPSPDRRQDYEASMTLRVKDL